MREPPIAQASPPHLLLGPLTTGSRCSRGRLGRLGLCLGGRRTAGCGSCWSSGGGARSRCAGSGSPHGPAEHLLNLHFERPKLSNSGCDGIRVLVGCCRRRVVLLGTKDDRLRLLLLPLQGAAAEGLLGRFVLVPLLPLALGEGALQNTRHGEVVRVHHHDRLTNARLHLRQQVVLVVPGSAPALVHVPLLFVPLQHLAIGTKRDRQLGVPRKRGAALAPGRTLVVPDLLTLRGHQRDGQAQTFSSTASPDAVNVVLNVVRQRHLDDEGQARDVDAACSHIRADHEPDVALLEGLQVVLTLTLVPRACQDNARVRVLLAALELTPVRLGALKTAQVGLQVVAVNICAAEDQALRHVERISQLHDHLGFHDLHTLGHAQGFRVLLVEFRHAGFGVHRIEDGLFRRELCTACDLLIGPLQLLRRVDEVGRRMQGVGHAVFPLQVHPRGLNRDLVNQCLDLWSVESGAEE
mmetsp:Transcript_19073/g.43314  ORF Transcript_19073/g.43314 Transcript_19073/m.43314 type:complete len:467 (+) Transcript_19073:122-1522(+)